jgi:hypothetical protein
MWLSRLLAAVLIGLLVLDAATRWLDERRTIRHLNRLDPERRRAIVKNIRPYIDRTYYDQRLRHEGEPEVGGAVERYPFSPRERREQAFLYWAIVLIASLVLLVLMIVSHASIMERGVSAVVVTACVAALWFLRNKGERLETILEVSPFGITEVHADGSRRHVSWDAALQLRVNGRRSRVELAPLGTNRDFIALDFDRLGFNRLMEHVIEYGGFRPALQGAQQAASTTSADSPAPSAR